MTPKRGGFLDLIERIGNKLPDPVLLFVIGTALVWGLSHLLAGGPFPELDPKTTEPIRVTSLLTGPSLVQFFREMVKTFTGFHPLGVVLVALLGVGVAEHVGLIRAGLQLMLEVTPAKLITPALIFVGILSHTAADAGYVLVVSLAGAIFLGAGRHPLAGIAAAFAGVAGGFSASLIPCSLDPMLQGITQQAGQLIDPTLIVNPLCNWYFNASTCFLIVAAGWLITDTITASRAKNVPIDNMDGIKEGGEPLRLDEKRGLIAALVVVAALCLLITVISWPAHSFLRDQQGSLTGATAPLMEMIVPLIFVGFLLPGVVYGVVAGTIATHRDIVRGMSKAMESMGYYLVMAFFASLFIDAFKKSNLGTLLAIKGANLLTSWQLPIPLMLVGVILLSIVVDLVIGSASAKWALLAPILVPMSMKVGISPELVQAAYRIGDSTTNIITPLMPYFPLVVTFCQRYCRTAGIGTLTSLMLPYSAVFAVLWTIWLLMFWTFDIPLGIGGRHSWP